MRYDQCVRAYVRSSLSDEMRALANQASYDLNFGPSGTDDDYPGFTKACAALKDALASLGEVWVDTNAEECSDTEPDEEMREFACVSRREALKAAFGELGEYLS